jgi:tetratricopeptide (TPR) repeat protein
MFTPEMLRNLTILILFLPLLSLSQDRGHFIEKLKDNSDQQVFTRLGIHVDLDKLDSTTALNTLASIENGLSSSSSTMKTRATALKARLLFYKLGPGDSLYAELMKAALYKAYDLDEPFMVAEYSRWYSELLNSLGKRNEAVQYALNAIVLQEQLGLAHFPTVNTFYFTIGELLLRTRNHRDAVQWLDKGLNWQGKDSVLPADYANALNNLGLCYQQQKDYRKAMGIFERIILFSQQHQLQNWYYTAYFNRITPFMELGQYDSCRKILNDLYELSQQQKSAHTMAGACYHLGQLANKQKDYATALGWLTRAEQYADQTGVRANKMKIFQELSTCYDGLQQFDKSLAYYKEFKYLDDSTDRAETSQRSDYLMTKANFEKQQLDLRKLRNKRQADIRLRNIGIVVLALLSGAVIWWLNRKRKNARQSQKVAEKQLNHFTQHIVDKDHQIEALQNELQLQSNNIEKAAKVEELSRQMILTEDDWEQFKVLFNKTYPGFLLRLKENAVGITEAELRLASLLKIQLGTRQISAMQGISADTVHKTKQRLRQRFGTSSTSELEAMIASV